MRGYRVIIQTEVLVNAENKLQAKTSVLDIRESIAYTVRKHGVPARELKVKVKR